ncbi:MAG: sulfotransferase [Pseudomonas sp.]
MNAGGIERADPLARLLACPVADVIALARQLVEAGQAPRAAALLDQVVPRRAFAPELHQAWAWVHWQNDAPERAEAILAGLLRQAPDHLDATLLLAELLRAQARLQAVARLLCGYAQAASRPQPVLRRIAGFLDASRLQAEALQVCELGLHQGPDPELLAMAAGLCLVLGQFDMARRHALAAWDGGADLEVRFLPYLLAMSRRCRDRHDPDLERIGGCIATLTRPRARATAHFALAKLHDDLGEHARAAAHLRSANRLAASVVRDNAADWEALERAVVAEPPLRAPAPVADDAPVPVFIVGLPRTGSTLLATRLARHPGVRDRGELPTIAFLRRGLAGSGRLGEPAAMREAAALYLRHLVQDDAPARWYLDKAPMNGFHLGLIAALFPNARILWCRRDPRDTALSIWMQHFVPGELDFAYDFAGIRRVGASCARLLAHWQTWVPTLPLQVVDYEALVTRPQQTLARVFGFLGVPMPEQAAAAAATGGADGAIATASAWQARQPLHANSLGRAGRYARWIPELAGF